MMVQLVVVDGFANLKSRERGMNLCTYMYVYIRKILKLKKVSFNAIKVKFN